MIAASSLVLSHPRVELVGWPDDADRREACATRRVRCLLVLDRGVAIPPLRSVEDWVYADADERDVAARLARLAAEPTGPVDEAVDLVRPLVGLTADEHRVVVRLLASQGRLVPRAHLPIEDLDAVIESARAVLEPAGWVILAVGTAGHVLVQRREVTP